MKENLKYELVKFVNGELEMDVSVSPNEDTVWLTKEQMALLFERDRSVISRHINNIYQEGELDKKTSVQFLHISSYNPKNRPPELYNLDVIISVGYRVKSKNGLLFRKWANSILKEYLLKGYVINGERSLVTDDNYLRLLNKVDSLNERVNCIENKYKELEFNNSQLFFNESFYDAYSFIQKLFDSAQKEIIIIDNYIDRSVLDRLVVKQPNVQVILYTSKKTKLIESDISSFNSQYGNLKVQFVNNVHDRFIIIDHLKIYHLGHSIKDVGKKIFSINQLNTDFINLLLKHIE